MTTVYFIRHAQSDFKVRDERERPLTAKGLADAESLVGLFKDHAIDRIYSSPYVRTIQTITPLARARDLDIVIREDFHERFTNVWYESLDDFFAFAERQWADFDHKIDGGESLREVQVRNVAELTRVLDEASGQRVAIATHGTALCTILNHFDPSCDFDYFMGMVKVTPYCVTMKFDGHSFLGHANEPREG